MHVFSADGPFAEFIISIDGQVETQDTEGVVRGTFERFPPSLFLRDTALTQSDAAICEFAQTIRAAGMYKTWRDQFDPKGWDELEKITGKLL